MLDFIRAQLHQLRDETGQTLIEYALLAFLIAIAAILFLAAIGLDLAETFDAVENALGLGASNDATTDPAVSDAATASGVN